MLSSSRPQTPYRVGSAREPKSDAWAARCAAAAGTGPAPGPARGCGSLRLWPGGLAVSRVSSVFCVLCEEYCLMWFVLWNTAYCVMWHELRFVAWNTPAPWLALCPLPAGVPPLAHG